jgi:predicted PilT family ATPase
MIGCIIGNGGQIIRSLQQELNVQMNVRPLKNSEEGEDEILLIKGVRAKVALAKVKVLQVISLYLASTEIVQLSEEMVPMVVGKKGSRIGQLREKFPDAIIDLADKTLRIQSSTVSTRQAVSAAIEEIVRTNNTCVVPLELDVGIIMKGTRGNECRTALSNLNVKFDIIPETGCVKLRGVQENVVKAIELVESFRLNNFSISISCLEEDFSTIFNMGLLDESPLKTLETDFSVDVRPSRKEGIILIRGAKPAVERAKVALQGMLNGDILQGSLIFPVDHQAFSFIIGKGGGTLKKLESENHVKIDVLKARDLLRVRGTAVAVEAAKLVLLKLIDDIKITYSIDISTLSDSKKKDSNEKSTEKLIGSVGGMFQVEASREKDILTIRGNLYLAEGARQYIKEIVDGRAVFCQPIPAHLLCPIRTMKQALESVMNKHEVEIEVLPKDNRNSATSASADVSALISNAIDVGQGSMFIRGTTAAVTAARKEILHLLSTTFATEFISVSVSSSCISCLKDMGSLFSSEIYSTCEGAILTVDRPLHSIRIAGTIPAVTQAADLIKEKLSKWSDHHTSISVDEHMLPVIMGKNGSAIIALQKELKVNIHLNRSVMQLELECSVPGNLGILEEAVKIVTERVAKLRQSEWKCKVDPTLIGLLVGKQGKIVLCHSIYDLLIIKLPRQ